VQVRQSIHPSLGAVKSCRSPGNQSIPRQHTTSVVCFAYSPLRSRLPTHINTFHRQPLYHTTLAIVAQLVLYSTEGYESIARTTWGLCNSRHPCKRAPLVLKHLRSKISSDCHHSKSVRATMFGSQRVHYYFRSPVNFYSQFKHESQN
jgi:hypothetical protein